MPLPIFIDSSECRLRVHCSACRNLEGGRQFRTSLATHFTLPADAPDFACPHGLEWGAAPPRVVVPPPHRLPPSIPLAGDLVEKAAKLIGADRLAQWYEQKTGKSCGCKGRKAAANWADRAIRRLVGRIARRG